jgi:protein-disulfide isomerase
MKKLLLAICVALAACGGAKPAPEAPKAPADAKVTSTPAVQPDAQKGVDAPSEDDSPIPIGKDDPSWGSRMALVTIVEMTDLQCPFCAKAHGTMRALEEKYGPDKLRIVWKHRPLPFHPNARPAAEWAQAVFATAGSDAFGCFVGKAFDGQQKMGADAYRAWAADCGANASRVDADVASKRWSAKIDDDGKLADKLGANGTPTFYVNGVKITGAQPLDKFTRAVDELLSISQQLLDKGAPRDRLYVIASTVLMQAAQEEEEGEPKEDTTTVYKVPVDKSPARGPAAAPVTIVEFSDFQCPYCKRAEETLVQIRQKYGDKVRFVWKDEPLAFHPRAEPAAEIAREARAEKGDAAFWEVHDLLFASQPKLDDEDLLAVAKKAGLDPAKARAAIQSKRHKKDIDRDADMADDFDANGTPHFFINGRRLVGAQPYDKFAAIIDEELKKADAARARGVLATAMYDELTKSGKGPREPEKKAAPAAPANAPFRGSAQATVTIQEFSDFQCPYCKRAEDTMKEVLQAYPGRVKIVWRNMPLSFHEDASLAAQASMEAYAQKGNDGFWKMHDLMYEHQADGGLKRDALDGYAKQLGLDMKRWGSALDGGTHKAAVDKDGKAGSDAGVNGTPAFFINGYFISGAQPMAKFRKVVDRALSEAAKR